MAMNHFNAFTYNYTTPGQIILNPDFLKAILSFNESELSAYIIYDKLLTLISTSSAPFDGHADLIKNFLMHDRSIDIGNPVKPYGRSILYLLCTLLYHAGVCDALVELIKERGKSMNLSFIDPETKSTPLHLVCQYLPLSFGVLEALINAGADTRIVDDDGQSAFDIGYNVLCLSGSFNYTHENIIKYSTKLHDAFEQSRYTVQRKKRAKQCKLINS